MSIRLLLVDDDDLVRMGLKMILESDNELEVVGEAPDGAVAVTLVEQLNPDVVLMDIQMPEMDGIEATRLIANRSTGDEGPRILMLTTFEQDEFVFQALRAGASGFLLKRTPADELISGIKVISAGDSLLSPSVTKRLINEFAQSPSSSVDPNTAGKLELLTERETEVLHLVARGLSNQELATELVVTEGTVKTHVQRVLAKLGVRDRTQAVIFAYNAGLVQPGTNSH